MRTDGFGGADQPAERLAPVTGANGTSPGKNVLRQLLEAHTPCVVLMDELVVSIRQFAEGETLSGGTGAGNPSFVHALT